MADQKKWFKVWTSIIANGKFAEMTLEDIGRWTLLGAATALDGDKGFLEVPGIGKELCRLLRVVDLDAAKDALKRIQSVSFEEIEKRYGKRGVTWHNWSNYQDDSTAKERMKALRAKRRGEDIRTDEKRGEEIVYPDWFPQKEWCEFREYRKEAGNPLTKLGEKKAVNKIRKLKAAGYDPIEVIDQSIANGWTGLFEVKSGKPSNKIVQLQPGKYVIGTAAKTRRD